MDLVMARHPDKGRADMVSSKSLIMSLCLLLAMAASYYWFIKLAWINVINAITHSFNGKNRETFVTSISVKKKTERCSQWVCAHIFGLI